MPIYNKLVRDLIPEIIINKGKIPTTRLLCENEYIEELGKKAYEELEEYIKAQTQNDVVEELADLLEIIHAISEYHGSSIREVEEVRKQKYLERGGFSKKVFLIEVKEEEKI